MREASPAAFVSGGCPSHAVIVSRHAVDRYKNRVLCWERKEMPHKKIVELLQKVVRRGERVSRLPGVNVWQYAYQGIYLAVAHRQRAKVVVTCLGDKEYRTWHRKKKRRR